MTEPIRPFRALFVCAGNTCRSPMAAQLLRAHLAEAPGFAVESAGILAEIGSPMTPNAHAVLLARLGSVAPHRARQLTVLMVTSADLVLTATRAIRADTVRSAPAAVRRTFAMKEFARLADRMPPDAVSTLDELTASVAAERAGTLDSDDDIADPIGKSDREYERVASEIDAACQSIARALLSARRSSAGSLDGFRMTQPSPGDVSPKT